MLNFIDTQTGEVQVMDYHTAQDFFGENRLEQILNDNDTRMLVESLDI